MWKDLLKNQILKGARKTHTFERRVNKRGNNNTMVSYDYDYKLTRKDYEIDWTSVVIEWSMSVEVYGDGLELNAPQVQKVYVNISYIEELSESKDKSIFNRDIVDEKLLAENLELETTENIDVDELDRVGMGSVILPDADILIGQKDGEFYIKKVDISW